MSIDVKKPADSNMAYKNDIQSLRDRLTKHASASFQRTYTQSYKIIKRHVETQTDLAQLNYFPAQLLNSDSIVDELIEFTLEYFQNDKQAIKGFVATVLELKKLARIKDVFPMFQHQHLDIVIDKHAEYSHFQEIIDEMEQCQNQLTEKMLLDAKIVYGMKIRKGINQLKAYYPFIETLINRFSAKKDIVKGIAIKNFFCYIFRPDRIRPNFNRVYSEFFSKLIGIVSH